MSFNSPFPIPDKRYFTIGEVSELCEVKPHVLRYWEQEFSQLKPNKRRGNRRYYQHKDVQLIQRIKSLLYQQGFTINGAKQQLSMDAAPTEVPVSPEMNAETDTSFIYRQAIDEINRVIAMLKSASL